jgi:hypothetical protein
VSAESMQPNNAGEPNSQGTSRRSFLTKLGLGVVGLAGLTSGLVSLGGQPQTAQDDDEFPGPDSIFHPAQDPRTDPRRG